MFVFVCLCLCFKWLRLAADPYSSLRGSQTKTTNGLFSKKRQVHKQKRQTVYFHKKVPSGSQTKTRNGLFIHHSAFPIRHSVLVNSSFGIHVCVYACKETYSLFVSYFYQKVIKNCIQGSPGRLPGPPELVILRCVLANLQKKHAFRARVTHINVTTLERNACFF